LPWLDADETCAGLRPDSKIRHLREVDLEEGAAGSAVSDTAAVEAIHDNGAFFK
jgi:hypothetical protein